MKEHTNKILVFGGSFDPPHLGHKYMLYYAIQAIKPDKVIVMPAKQQPLKGEHVASAEHRIEMVRKLFEDNKNVWVWQYEILKKDASYTRDTLDYVRGIYPDAEIFFLMGEDSFENLDKWKDYIYILAHYNIVVAKREGTINVSKYSGIAKNIMFLKNSENNFSSSRAREGNLTALTDEIKKYIKKNNLYGGGKPV